MEIPAHRCRFIDYIPSEIRHIQFSPESWTKSSYLACARANGNIELWRLREAGYRWHLERTIPGSPTTSVQALAWAHQTSPSKEELDDLIFDEDDDSDNQSDIIEKYKNRLQDTPPRLFTVGEDATITEWNTTTLKSKQFAYSNGGAVLCIKVSPCQAQLALGCADGTIRLFSIIENRLEYIKHLSQTDKTKIISLAYSSDGSVIVAGSADSYIYRFELSTGKCSLRLNMDKFNTGTEEVLVWDILLLKDNTIVSADSNGNIQFRDGRYGTINYSFKAHQADALCLATNSEGNVVFSGSVDCNVIRFSPIETRTSPRKWVISGQKKYHSHDVHTIAIKTNKPYDILASGGIDTLLSILPDITSFPNIPPYRTPHFPHRPIISICKEKRWVMSMFSQRLLIYRLGNALQPLKQTVDHEKKIFGTDLGERIRSMSFKRIPLSETGKLLFDISLNIKSNLVSSAISPNGKWIAASDNSKTMLMAIEHDQQTGIYSVRKFQTLFPPSYTILFTPDSNRLILAGFDLCIRVFENTSVDYANDPNIIWTPSCKIDEYKDDAVYNVMETDESTSCMVAGNVPRSDLTNLIAVSGDGQWLATAELNGLVRVYHFDSMKLDWIPPRLPSAATALAFHPAAPTLIIVTSTNDIRMYNVEKKRASDWTKEYSQRLPTRFKNHRDIVTGIGFGIASDQIQNEPLVLWGPKFICVIDVEQSITEPTYSKSKKARTLPPPSSPQQSVTNSDYPSSKKEMIGIDEPHHQSISSNSGDEVLPPNDMTNVHNSNGSQHNILSPPQSPPPSRPVSQLPKSDQPNGKKAENFRMTVHLSPIMYLSFLDVERPSTTAFSKELDLNHEHDDVVMQESEEVRATKPLVGKMKEMVLVERPEVDIMKKLPPAHKKIKYGM